MHMEEVNSNHIKLSEKQIDDLLDMVHERMKKIKNSNQIQEVVNENSKSHL